MSHARLAALALAATSLVAAGCGSSSSSGLSSAELIAKAEPICERANAELRVAMAATKPSAVIAAANQAATYEQQASVELAKLTPPSSLTSNWKVIVTSYHTLGSDLTQLSEAKANKTKPSAALVTEFSNSQLKRVTAAAHHGFNYCAQD